MVWYKVGSIDEVNGTTGVSHALEHMMFKGTKNHKVGDFSRLVAELGGQENAFTANDFTAYFQQIEEPPGKGDGARSRPHGQPAIRRQGIRQGNPRHHGRAPLAHR
jgi:hypothetical protein